MKKIWVLVFTVLSCARLLSEEINWSSPPVVLSSGTHDASNSQVGIDSNGNAVAAWIENGFVKSSNLSIGGSWSTATTLSNAGAFALQMVVDENGNATAVWVENGIVQTTTQLSNGSWSIATTLSSSGAVTPQIAVDLNGDVVAIWARNGAIESSTKPFSGSWSAVSEIYPANSADSPQVAIGLDNITVVAVWHAIITSQDTVFSANKSINGSWSAAEAIGDGVNPQIAVDSNGNAIATWFGFNVSGVTYTNVALIAIPKPFGGAWGSSKSISTQFGIRNPVDLVARIAFDGEGNSIAFWNNSFDGSTFTIELSASMDGGLNWADPMAPVAMNLCAYDLDVSVVGSGDAFAIYMLYDIFGSSVIIQSSESDLDVPNFQLGLPVTLNRGDTNNGFPRIAASSKSSTLYAVAVWMNFDGVHNNIQSVSAIGKVIQPPANLSVTQSVNDFGVFKEYYNTLTWDPSTSSNVTQYLIFRNGQLISSIGANTLQFVDENRVPHEAGTYGVAAFDIDFSQSSTITVNFPP